MRIFITGGTGFIGRALTAELARAGHRVSILSRTPDKVAALFPAGPQGQAQEQTVDGLAPDRLAAALAEAGEREPSGTAVVNLAGENIFGRWTPEKRQRILESRLDAGRLVLQAVQACPARPRVLVQASAVGYYGPRSGEAVTEEDASGDGFLADVARRWEASTAALEDLGVRRVVIRTGVVLGPGGALEKMLPAFRRGLGGPLGSGRQNLSWIHLDDEVGAIRFLLEHPTASGPFNLTAPSCVTSAQFARTLGRVLHRPAFLRVPGPALRLLWGDMAKETLLSGQCALPARLTELDYAFRHAELTGALAHILRPGA